ncbi:Protein Mono-Adp-Ribosyltransferase Parp10 [Manis pentadactyla]|nr:Protein Mono-Adp-Ribosyltransferase Parp10 [Manis pentadactyla]
MKGCGYGQGTEGIRKPTLLGEVYLGYGRFIQNLSDSLITLSYQAVRILIVVLVSPVEGETEAQLSR